MVSLKFYHVQNDFIISSNFIAQIADYFFLSSHNFSLFDFLNIHGNLIFQTKYKISLLLPPSFFVIRNTYVIYNDGCYSKCMLIIRSIYRHAFLFVLTWMARSTTLFLVIACAWERTDTTYPDFQLLVQIDSTKIECIRSYIHT